MTVVADFEQGNGNGRDDDRIAERRQNIVITSIGRTFAAALACVDC